MFPNNEGIIKRKIIYHNKKKNPKHIHKPPPDPKFHQVKHLTRNNNIYICNCLFLKRFYNEEDNDYIEPRADNIKFKDLNKFKVLVNKYPENITKIDYIKDFYIEMKFIRENDLCNISYNGQIFNFDIIDILYKHTFNDKDKNITEEQYNKSYNGRLQAYFLDYNYPRIVINNEIKEQIHKIEQYNNRIPYYPEPSFFDFKPIKSFSEQQEYIEDNNNYIPINQTHPECLDKRNRCNILKFSTKIPKMFIPKSIITSIIPIDVFIETNKDIIINQDDNNEDNDEEKIIKQITIYAQLIIMPNGLMFIDLNDDELLTLPYEYEFKYFNIPGFTISYNPSLPEPTKETFEYYLNKTPKYYDLSN